MTRNSKPCYLNVQPFREVILRFQLLTIVEEISLFAATPVRTSEVLSGASFETTIYLKCHE
jgi:hypothetical protein